MSAGEPLTESVRVRLSANEKAELERQAVAEDRSSSAIARRGIRAELDRLRQRSSSKRA